MVYMYFSRDLWKWRKPMFLPQNLVSSFSVNYFPVPLRNGQIRYLCFRGATEHEQQKLRCQFHQHFTYKFFVQISFFYVHVTRKSCQNATFVWKICTFNVDKIDYRLTFLSWQTRASGSIIKSWPLTYQK